MLTGRLFHKVAAAFPKFFYHTSHNVFVVWLAVVWTQISGTVLDAKQKQVHQNTEGQSHVSVYMHKLGFCTVTFIWLGVSVVCSHLWMWVTSTWAVELFTLCRLSTSVFGIPYRITLPQCSWNVIKACAGVLQASVMLSVSTWSGMCQRISPIFVLMEFNTQTVLSVSWSYNLFFAFSWHFSLKVMNSAFSWFNISIFALIQPLISSNQSSNLVEVSTVVYFVIIPT